MSTITVTFSQAVKNNVAVKNAANYVVTGPTSPTVTAVSRLNDYQVQLTIDIMLIGGAYTLTISNVTSKDNAVIASPGNACAFVGDDVKPKPVSMAFRSGTTWRLTFDKPMAESGLEFNGSYWLSGDSNLGPYASLTQVSAYAVDIEMTHAANVGGDYRIGCFLPGENGPDSCKDTAGNGIDPDNRWVDFVGAA